MSLSGLITGLTVGFTLQVAQFSVPNPSRTLYIAVHVRLKSRRFEVLADFAFDAGYFATDGLGSRSHGKCC